MDIEMLSLKDRANAALWPYEARLRGRSRWLLGTHEGFEFISPVIDAI
jgi:hypothetical protein